MGCAMTMPHGFIRNQNRRPPKLQAVSLFGKVSAWSPDSRNQGLLLYLLPTSFFNTLPPFTTKRYVCHSLHVFRRVAIHGNDVAVGAGSHNAEFTLLVEHFRRAGSRCPNR